MGDAKTPNEQAWWDKTWQPFKYHIRLRPRFLEKPKTVNVIARYLRKRKSRKQIQEFIEMLRRDNPPFHHR